MHGYDHDTAITITITITITRSMTWKEFGSGTSRNSETPPFPAFLPSSDACYLTDPNTF